MDHLLNDLVAISREYGSDSRWVVAGGGNTSLKDSGVLYVKASGFALATIGEDGFARMDRKKLAAIWEADYPVGDDAVTVAEREKRVLADTMDARMPGDTRRPSVETLLHDILPWPLVVHLHPTLVNGLTCGVRGKETAAELFGDTMEWIPYTDPGYILAATIRESLESRAARDMAAPEYIFLANHGVFAGGADANEVREKYTRLDKVLMEKITRRPGAMPQEKDLKDLAPQDSSDGLMAIDKVATDLFGENARWRFVAGGELENYLLSRDAAVPLTGCITPDHIVYAGPGALFLGSVDFASGGFSSFAAAWRSAASTYIEERGKVPNLLLFRSGNSAAGAIITAADEKALGNAQLLLENALEVLSYSESFGGPQLMEERYVRFIVNWEAESYRSNIARRES